MIGRITGAARLAGVIGRPVSHSLSPILHNYWLARLGVDGAYVPLPVASGRFVDAVRGLQAAGFRGANVTIPYKEEAYALADSLDPLARVAGSVNTLIFRDDGGVHGASTDGFGFLASLEDAGVDVTTLPAKGPALLLGAGGAARSVALALLERGVAVCVSNRTDERARALVEELGATWREYVGAACPELSVMPWDAWQSELNGFSLLVNSTSLGMHGGPDEAFAPDLGAAGDDLAVSDIVYVPLETGLLRAARARGLRTVGGLGMLLHQARPGFRAWFGAEATVDAATVAHVMAALKR